MQGHACPILYAAWCEAGLLSKEDLLTLRKVDSILEGHPTPVRTPPPSCFSSSLSNTLHTFSSYSTYVLAYYPAFWLSSLSSPSLFSPSLSSPSLSFPSLFYPSLFSPLLWAQITLLCVEIHASFNLISPLLYFLPSTPSSHSLLSSSLSLLSPSLLTSSARTT